MWRHITYYFLFSPLPCSNSNLFNALSHHLLLGSPSLATSSFYLSQNGLLMVNRFSLLSSWRDNEGTISLPAI